MATLFSKIIAGEIPGRFVWQDDLAVAFLTIAPITPGHVLVVPRTEVDHWVDADDLLLSHLVSVAKKIGRAQQVQWQAQRIGLLIQGYEIPHLHIHVWPTNSVADFDPANTKADVPESELDEAAIQLRARLRSAGFEKYVPEA